MITTTTLQKQDTTGSAVLYMALELSNTKWKVGFSNGEKIRQVTGWFLDSSLFDG